MRPHVTMCLLLLLCVMLLPTLSAVSQIVEFHSRDGEVRRPEQFNKLSSAAIMGLPDEASKLEEMKFEKTGLFKSTGFDMYLTGQGQTSIQIVKIIVGEPGQHFQMPIYLFLAPATDIGNARENSNELAAANLVNPLGGTLNFSVNNVHTLDSIAQDTRLNLGYHAAAKMISGTDLNGSRQKEYQAIGYFDIGLFYHTRAWIADDPENLGYFWVMVKVHGSFGNPQMLEKFFGMTEDKAVYGASADVGIEIDKRISLRLGYSAVLNKNKLVVNKNDFVKFAFNFRP